MSPPIIAIFLKRGPNVDACPTWIVKVIGINTVIKTMAETLVDRADKLSRPRRVKLSIVN